MAKNIIKNWIKHIMSKKRRNANNRRYISPGSKKEPKNKKGIEIIQSTDKPVKQKVKERNSAVETSKQLVPSDVAYIYASEVSFIAKCINDYPNIETGGQLFGSWTASGTPRIIYAIGPGRNANHEEAFFNQDVEYLELIGAKLKEFGLQHIGEWHSHHKLGIESPSGHDAHTMQNGIVSLELHRMCLCIGVIKREGVIINPFNFAEGSQYVEAKWQVIKENNRLRGVIDSQLKDVLIMPDSKNESVVYPILENKTQQKIYSLGWFADEDNRMEFKRIVETICKKINGAKVKPCVLQDGTICIGVKISGCEDNILFPNTFPDGEINIERVTKYEESRIYDIGCIQPEDGEDVSQTVWKMYSDFLKKMIESNNQHKKENGQ